MFPGNSACHSSCSSLSRNTSAGTLNQGTAGLSEEIYVSCVGARESGCKHRVCVSSGDIEDQGEDGMVLKLLSYRKVNPVSLSWESDPSAAACDSGGLTGWWASCGAVDLQWGRMSTLE